MAFLCVFLWNILIVQSDQRLQAAKRDLTPPLSLTSYNSVYTTPGLVMKISEDVYLPSSK